MITFVNQGDSMRQIKDEQKRADETTGGLGGLLGYTKPGRFGGFQGGFFMMGQDPGEALALSDLTGVDLKVFLLLIKRLDFENLLVVNQAELAGKLGTQRQNIQRSLKKLIEFEVLLEGPKKERSRTYRLNPDIGWKGTSENHVLALNDYRQNRASALKVLEGGKGEASAPELGTEAHRPIRPMRKNRLFKSLRTVSEDRL
jgi:hypothetical protein